MRDLEWFPKTTKPKAELPYVKVASKEPAVCTHQKEAELPFRRVASAPEPSGSEIGRHSAIA